MCSRTPIRMSMFFMSPFILSIAFFTLINGARNLNKSKIEHSIPSIYQAIVNRTTTTTKFNSTLTSISHAWSSLFHFFLYSLHFIGDLWRWKINFFIKKVWTRNLASWLEFEFLESKPVKVFGLVRSDPSIELDKSLWLRSNPPEIGANRSWDRRAASWCTFLWSRSSLTFWRCHRRVFPNSFWSLLVTLQLSLDKSAFVQCEFSSPSSNESI